MAGLLDNIDNLHLDINGVSKHLRTAEGIPSDYKYNESNPGFGLSAEFVNDSVVKSLMGGTYKNSFNNRSYYAGGSLAKRFGKNYYADLGVFGGLVSGYDEAKGTHNGLEYNFDEYKKLNPMGGLMMNLGKKGVGRLGLKYMPSEEGVVMVNLGIPLK